MPKPFVIVTGTPNNIEVDGKLKYMPQKYHTASQQRDYDTFREMVDALPHEGKGPVKHSLGYFVPGGLLEYAVPKRLRTEGDKRGTRTNGNIGNIHFVSYDLDDLAPDEATTVIDELYDSGYESFYYHTASSTPEKPKLRVLISLSGPACVDTEAKANLMIDIAQDVWGAGVADPATNKWYFLGIQFDKSAFREAQYQIRPHDGAESEYFPGDPVDLDELPPFAHGWKLDGVYNTEYGQGDFDDADVTDWTEWATGRGLTIEGRKIIVLCPNRDNHSYDSDGANTTTILMPAGAHGEARFNCKHEGCDEHNRRQRDSMIAIGVPEALLPEAHGANAHQRQHNGPAFSFKTSTTPAATVAAPRRERAKAKQDGLCGDYRDAQRKEIADMCARELWQIPPDVQARRDKHGDIIGFKTLNTDDNLAWLLHIQKWNVARNLMTYEFETFGADGKALTRSADETDSLVTSEAARRDFPETTYANHIRALASKNTFHPVAKILHGRKWDGVERVDRVIDCLPVTDTEYTHALLKALFVGAISAIDEGSVQMKFCPVLFSKSNDWHKSAFAERVFSITDRAFKGGIPVPDPTDKDSLNNVILCWGGELGELGGMGKRDTETLKAWLPQASDEWRPPYAKNTVRKPRQSVYIGTINRDDFIKDPTLATRFPVIKLAGAVQIDKLNTILGWEYDGNRAVLKDAEQLTQFWLEVRQMKAEGASYIIPSAVMDKVRAISEDFTDKGGFYTLTEDVLAQTPDTGSNHAWQTSTQFCDVCNVPTQHNRNMGKALKQLFDEDVLDRKRVGGSYLYWLPTTTG